MRADKGLPAERRGKTFCAAARLSAWLSSRSTLKSSDRIGSSGAKGDAETPSGNARRKENLNFPVPCGPRADQSDCSYRAGRAPALRTENASLTVLFLAPEMQVGLAF